MLCASLIQCMTSSLKPDQMAFPDVASRAQLLAKLKLSHQFAEKKKKLIAPLLF